MGSQLTQYTIALKS